MQLEHNLEIARITKNFSHNKKYNFDVEYAFVYKNYCATLETKFSQVACTQNYYLPIINFGYSLRVEAWDNRRKSYQWIHEHDEEDGSSTKKYIDSQEARFLIKKFLFKSVHRYLESVMPPILIRGVMTPFKQSSPRYLYIDEMIQKYGYTKISVPYEQLGSFDSCYTTQEPDESAYWIYVKDSFVKDEVEHYFLKESGDVSHPSKKDNTKYLTFQSFSATRPFNFLDQPKIKRSLLSHAC